MLAIFGAAAATGMPRYRSIECLAKVAACAELPRAQVTANPGDRRTRLVTSSVRGTAISLACRETAADASRNSAAVPKPSGLVSPDVWYGEEITPPGPARQLP